MQTLIIRNFDENKRIKSKFNIGQKVFCIDYDLSQPIVIEGYILAIGISSPFQTDDLIYLIDRSIKQSEEMKKYYKDDLFLSQSAALVALGNKLIKYGNDLVIKSCYV